MTALVVTRGSAVDAWKMVVAGIVVTGIIGIRLRLGTAIAHQCLGTNVGTMENEKVVMADALM